MRRILNVNSPNQEFETKYPNLSGLAFDFSDPPPGHQSDDETARRIRSDWPVIDRIDIFKRLLSDSDRLLFNIESDWQPLRVFVNRAFTNAAEAKEWLIEIRAAWQNELSRLNDL